MKKVILTAAVIVVCLVFSSLVITSVSAQDDSIPPWIKSMVGFWINGEVDDTEFLNAIQFLVNEGVIQVKSQNDLENISKLNPQINETKKETAENYSLKSKLQTQNLKGDIIDSWGTWKIVDGDLFHIHAQNSTKLTKERVDAIVDVLMSTEVIEGQDYPTSKYYVGWSGALNSMKQVENAPKKLHFHITEKGEGHVIINLTDGLHSDGYIGFTKNLIDEDTNEFLKSMITIYDVENLSISELKKILRHELGHVFGLVHSTEPTNLMFPNMAENTDYISECNVDILNSIYDSRGYTLDVCKK